VIRSPDLGTEPQWPDMEKQLKLLTIRLIPVGLDATSAVRVIRRVPRGPARQAVLPHDRVSAEEHSSRPGGTCMAAGLRSEPSAGNQR